MIPFHSVKFRLTLWHSFILSIFLGIFAVFMHFELSRVLYSDADRLLVTEARSIEESLPQYLQKALRSWKPSQTRYEISSSPYFDPEVKNRVVESLRQWEESQKKVYRSRMMVRVLGVDHEPLIMNLKPWEQEIIFPDFERDSTFLEHGKSYQTIHFRKMPIRLYYHLVTYQDVPLLVIQCGNSIQSIKDTLHRLLLIISISIPVAIILSFIAGWFMAKRSFLPLDLMIRDARKITGPDIKGRLPRTMSGDELDRLAETLNEMMDRMDASQKVIREFSSDISHELRTPLAIIRGEIDLALRKTRSAEDLIRTLHVIQEETDELIRLVDDLIFLVRTDAKQLRFQMTECSLSAVVQAVVERFHERAQKKEIKIQTQIAPEVSIQGDAVYLKRIFNNVIDNAIKFTPQGGNVLLQLESISGKAQVTITDSGMGIESDKIKKLFSRFYRTEEARQYEGSGLGLNIAKAICDAHKGTISIASQVLQGTKVQVSFPLIR